VHSINIVHIKPSNAQLEGILYHSNPYPSIQPRSVNSADSNRRRVYREFTNIDDSLRNESRSAVFLANAINRRSHSRNYPIEKLLSLPRLGIPGIGRSRSRISERDVVDETQRRCLDRARVALITAITRRIRRHDPYKGLRGADLRSQMRSPYVAQRWYTRRYTHTVAIVMLNNGAPDPRADAAK